MKKYRYTFFAVIMAVVFIISHVSLMAETVEYKESQVNVSFTEGDATVEPLDPEEPTDPGTGGGGGESAIALNFVSTLLFDEQALSSFEAKYPTITKTPYIQVTDVRGTGEGWSVNARLSKFKNTTYDKDSLLGATIKFSDASCATPSTGDAPPLPSNPFTLKADGSTTVNVVSANSLTGMGTWLIKWYTNAENTLNNSVMLTVPGGSGMLGDNIATITWSLMNVPIE